jgi:site-specific recombinase XerD
MARSTAILLKKYREWLVCQRYSDTTLRTYDKIANQFIEFWGKPALTKVRPSNIQDFLLSLAYRDLSADVVRRNLWGLRSFFDFLCLRGLVGGSAPRYIRPRPEPKATPRALSKENARRLIAATTNDRDRALLEMYYATGCRVSELAGVRLEDVDFANRMLWIRGKYGKSRRVFFGPAASRYLKKYLKNRDEGFLFENRNPVQKGHVRWDGYIWVGYWRDYTDPRRTRYKNKSLGKGPSNEKEAWELFRQLVPNPDEGHLRCRPHGLARATISDIFRRAAHRARLGKVTAHNLRHSFAVHTLDNGADIRHVQELLGHANVATTHRYASAVSFPTAKAYKRFHPRAGGRHGH